MHLWGSPFSPRDTKHLLDDQLVALGSLHVDVNNVGYEDGLNFAVMNNRIHSSFK